MLEAVSTIAFLVMVVVWATVEPARALKSRTFSKGQPSRAQSVQS